MSLPGNRATNNFYVIYRATRPCLISLLTEINSEYNLVHSVYTLCVCFEND